MNVIQKVEIGRGDCDDAARITRLCSAAAAVLAMPDEAWEASLEGPVLRARLAVALAAVLEDQWDQWGEKPWPSASTTTNARARAERE